MGEKKRNKGELRNTIPMLICTGGIRRPWISRASPGHAGGISGGLCPSKHCHPKGKCNFHTSYPSPSKQGWGSKCFVQPTSEISVSALKQGAHSRQRRLCPHHASLCPLISRALPPRTATPVPKSHVSHTMIEQGANPTSHLQCTLKYIFNADFV